MRREEFISELKKKLGRLPAEELDDAVAYYDELFLDAGEENEEKTAASLGSIDAIARQIYIDNGIDPDGKAEFLMEEYVEPKRAEQEAPLPIKQYSEEMHLALWLTGKRVEGSWIHANEDTSFYELNAFVQNVFARLGLPMGMLVSEKTQNNIFQTGLTLKNRGGKVMAELGIVSHKLQKTFGIQNTVYYADLNWAALMKAIRKNKVEYKEISKYPAVSRDLALLIDKQVEFAQVEQMARQAERKLLKRVELFDVYEGKNLPEGKKSYAVNFILQDEQKTMGDKQIDAIMQKIISTLKQKLGAELR